MPLVIFGRLQTWQVQMCCVGVGAHRENLFMPKIRFPCEVQRNCCVLVDATVTCTFRCTVCTILLVRYASIIAQAYVYSGFHILPTSMSSQPQDDSFFISICPGIIIVGGEGWSNKYHTYDFKPNYSPDRRL